MARWDLTVRRDRFLATSCNSHQPSVLPGQSSCHLPASTPQMGTWDMPYLRDTLLMLSSEQNSPCNATGVLALEEEGFGLSILESEDLAITTDVKLSL